MTVQMSYAQDLAGRDLKIYEEDIFANKEKVRT